MKNDDFKPLDLNAFLKNSQLLQPSYKESYAHFLKQLMQKAIRAFEKNPEQAYTYLEEFKQNVPESILIDLFQVLEIPFEDRTIDDYINIEKKTVIDLEKVCVLSLKADFLYCHLDIDECAEECRKVLSIDKENKCANSLLGSCLALRMKYKEAIPYLKKVIDSPTYKYEAKANLAYCYFYLRKNFRAFYLSKQIVDELADNYRVQYYMALCYLRFWRFKKALYYLDRAEALEKNFSGIYLTRGSIYFRFKNWDMAFKNLYKAKELGNEQADVLLNTM